MNVVTTTTRHEKEMMVVVVVIAVNAPMTPASSGAAVNLKHSEQGRAADYLAAEAIERFYAKRSPTKINNRPANSLKIKHHTS